MYLITQLWWYLTLAFLLGALAGYLLWRACGRGRIEAVFASERRDNASRIAQLETERTAFTAAASEAEARRQALQRDLATRDTQLAASRAHEEKLTGELAALKEQMASAAAARMAEIKSVRDDAATALAASLKAHADNVKRAREAAAAEAAARHAEELKTALESAKRHEARVLALTQADAAARRELEEMHARHALELKTSREVAAAETAAKHAQELKAAHEAVKQHEAQVLALMRSDAAAKRELDDLRIRHAAELRKARDEATAVIVSAATTKAPASGAISSIAAMPAQSVTGDKPSDLLSAPRGGKADDLKLIWGVGPKLEKMLNAAGIYHFEQMAKWTDRELAWVDSQLGDFAGRAVRDKWIEQAQKLASGWRPSKEAGDKPA